MEDDGQGRCEGMGLMVKQRQTVMEELRRQYRHAAKKEKTRILDGFVDLAHLNRSCACSTLRAIAPPGSGLVHRPRASVYTLAVLPAFTEFWHLSDRPCGKRLVPGCSSCGMSLSRLLLSGTAPGPSSGTEAVPEDTQKRLRSTCAGLDLTSAMRSSSPKDVAVSEGCTGRDQLDAIAMRRYRLLIRKRAVYV